jgi:DNA-binding winged helix-turn-helix (wHTH) protein/TolB-like protein
MVMPNRTKHYYEFGPFRLDPEKHRLLRDGEPIQVSPKSIEALVVLAQNAGKLLERKALMQAVWADTFVEDANLTVAISHLRKALGQNGDTAEYIETIPRVGYRFVAEVHEVTEQPAPLIVEKHTLSRTVIVEEVLHDEPKGETATEAVPRRRLRTKILPFALNRKTIASLLSFATLCALAPGAVSYLKSHEQKAAIPSNAPLANIKSMAVLPPRPLSNEAENASLSLGMADALITRLGALHKVIVRPTTSVSRYVDNNQDPITAGRALGVDAVLEGSLQRNNGRTRVTLRLLDIAQGTQLWAGKFDEADADVFKLQDTISRQVAETLFLNLTQNEKALLTRRQTTNPEAYAFYLKGNYLWSKRGNEATKSIEYLRKAIEIDPTFAQAYATLAAVDATRANFSPEAEALLDKALRLDETLADAHATLGLISMFHHWDWATAESELDRAIELDPNSAVAHHWKGVYLSIRGRLDEAKQEMHRALSLDPLSLIIMADIGQLHYFAHEYDQALDYCNRALALDPEFWPAHEYLVDIYRMKGMDHEVLNELFNLDYRNSTPEARQRLREVLAQGGMRAIFTQQLNSYLSKNDNERIPIAIAKYFSRLDNNEHALYWLDRAVNGQRFFWTAYINADPLYDTLRDDPRFKEIIRRMNLP